ncbi:hypothetical protein JCM11641_001577 [Rhodosporidiobolus odoratus]
MDFQRAGNSTVDDSDELSLVALSLASSETSPVSSEASPSTVDRLSSLPPELLERIFHLVYVTDADNLSPLNRTLAPFHYNFTYSHRMFTCYNCMRRFMNCILDNPHLGKLVKTVIVSVDVEEDDEEEDDEEEAEASGGRSHSSKEAKTAPPVKRLTKFFKKLLKLKTLILVDAEDLVALALKPAFASRCLPSLEELRISTSLEQHNRPFNPVHFTALPLYPSLTRVKLGLNRPYASILAAKGSSRRVAARTLSRVEELALIASHLEPEGVGAILSGCNSLISLALVDKDGHVDLLQLIAKLPSPSLLQSLSLQSLAFLDEEEQQVPHVLQDVAPLLRSLLSLKHLTLLGPFATSSTTFLPAVEDLPLRTLHLGADSSIFPEQIFALLHPRTRHSFLTTLTLDNIFALRDGWNRDIVKEVRQAAKEAGVKVQGTTFEAPEIEDEFAEEVEQVDRYYECMAEEGAIDWVELMMDEESDVDYAGLSEEEEEEDKEEEEEEED